MTELHKAVLASFSQFSDRCAVSSGRDNTSYAELQDLIIGLQRQIAGKRAVGILSTRRLDAYVAVLASFLSGIRFVPMNPSLPVERLAAIATTGQVDLIVCDRSSHALAVELNIATVSIDDAAQSATGSRSQFLLADNGPAAIAYQMFTSGSTGVPKGVPISYGNLSHYVIEITRLLKLGTGGRYSQLFDLSFDLSMHDIFVAIANGGTLVPAGPMDLLMPHKYIEKGEIDHWFSVPVLAMVSARGQGDKSPPRQLQSALFCGEALPTDYALGFQKFIAGGGPLYNLYGPTEATIAFTAKRFDNLQTQFSTVPLGPVFGENKIAIETDAGDVVPANPGTTGELLLGGPQVFAGYEPDLGDTMFVIAQGVRFYRSGDLVDVVEDEIIHLGRKDSQIKMHGYRIELGEIEAVFRNQFNCNSAAAIVIGAGEQGRIVLAYEHSQTIDDQSGLADILPDYMIPKATLRVDVMPTNINGKIDRKSLSQLPWPA